MLVTITNKRLELKGLELTLTLKLVMLPLPLTGQLGQDIYLLSLEGMTVTTTSISPAEIHKNYNTRTVRNVICFLTH